MTQAHVKVQADSSYSDKAEEVEENLKNAGMTISESLPFIGHFRGIVGLDQIDALKAIPGVASVNVISDEGTPEQDDYMIS